MIYFIKSGDNGPVKIGYAVNITDRMEQLQTANPEKLEVILSLPGTFHKEKEIHEQFKHNRLRGEWFEYSDDLKRYIDEVCDDLILAASPNVYPPPRGITPDNITKKNGWWYLPCGDDECGCRGCVRNRKWKQIHGKK